MSHYALVLFSIELSQFLVFLIAVLLQWKRRAISYLFLIILLSQLLALSYLAYDHLKDSNTPGLLEQLRGLGCLHFAILGPVTYVFLKTGTNPQFKLRSRDWIHLLPFALSALVLVPFFITRQNVDNSTLAVVRGINGIVFGLYTIFCSRILRQYRQSLRQTISDPRRVRFYFGTILLAILVGLNLLLFSSMILYLNELLNVLLNFMTISFLVIAIFIQKYSLMFLSESEGAVLETVTNQPESKYKTSPLDEGQVKSYAEKIRRSLQQSPEILYDSQVNLSHLAKKVGLSPYLTSQVINMGLDSTFYDLVNDYRIQYARSLLLNNGSLKKSILEIAYMAGYNSKSTFNQAFKVRTGLTPTEFRKSHSLDSNLDGFDSKERGEER